MIGFVVGFVSAIIIGLVLLVTGCHQPAWQCTGTRSDGVCNAWVRR